MAGEEDTEGVRRRGKPTTPRKDGAPEEAAKTDAAVVKDADGKAKPLSEIPKRDVDFAGPLAKAIGFMEKEKFADAAKILEKVLKGLEKEEKDPACLHNLGVCYTELGALPEAEEVFWDSFERAPRTGDHVYKTMYGLASCLTAQDDPCKLLQAEALLREVLDKGMQREDLVEDIYRSFVLLAENLGRQKKWKDAATAWESSVAMGGNMFGEEHEMVVRHKISLQRAQRLAKWQGRLRVVTWTFFIVVPCVAAYYVYGTWYGPKPDVLESQAAEASNIPPGL